MAKVPMQLSDILTLAVQHRLEKRAGALLPIAIGATIPGTVKKSIERAHSVEKQLNDAEGKPFKTAAPKGSSNGPFGPTPYNPRTSPFQDMLSGALRGAGNQGVGGLASSLGEIAGAPGHGIASGLSHFVQKKLFGQEIGDRQDAMGVAGGAALKSFGAEIGKSGVGLLRDIANKAMEAVGNAGDQSARNAILGELKRTDPVLSGADDKVLMESYHTMTRFAPVLSTDKNAVRSFLRQAVMSGNGPDFMSIKHLADSERAVTGGKDAR